MMNIKKKVPYAVVILVGVALLVWLAFATRYFRFTNNDGVDYRVDGWTGALELLRCEDHELVRTCRWVSATGEKAR